MACPSSWPRITMRTLGCMIVLLLAGSCSLTPVPPPPPSPALLFLSSPASSQRLIVFVHGILGNSSTWMNRSGQSWADLMKEDSRFTGFSLAAYHYDTPFYGRTSGIEEVATRLLRQLEDDAIFDVVRKVRDEVSFQLQKETDCFHLCVARPKERRAIRWARSH
jgi:pimeloyl-ACP methyl ester carboxylesterase